MSVRLRRSKSSRGTHSGGTGTCPDLVVNDVRSPSQKCCEHADSPGAGVQASGWITSDDTLSDKRSAVAAFCLQEGRANVVTHAGWHWLRRHCSLTQHLVPPRVTTAPGGFTPDKEKT